MDIVIFVSVAAGLLIPAVIFGFGVRNAFRQIRGLLRKTDNHSDVAPDTVRPIEKTVLARLGLGWLDANAATVATAGTQRKAPMSIDDHILRPTAGVRGISLVVSAAMGFLLGFGDAGIFPAGGLGMKVLIGVGVLYAVIFIQTYEVRYNRDRLIAPGRAFNRREQNWRDLTRLQDNGHYLYVLTFADGSKLEVQKHLVGMADFLGYALDQIEKNTAQAAAPRTPSRPATSVFGSRKAFS